ncbi:hypothetical protein AVEN_242935-1 [Araneus ventricosus]|uniref:Uncharacterized protein n=1 Tax=Araneus ventricosus TaxID=182803 RepID=A0A4Y2SIJ5_ARAVE|nr:hypothetical protein AVEN_242935-1 [Araneus ventricosus]
MSTQINASTYQSSRFLQFSLVLLMFRFEATWQLFWDEHRNFEPRSDDEDDIGSCSFLSKLPWHTRWDIWPPTCGLACSRPNTRWISSGSFEPGTLRLRGRHPTTRPPRPLRVFSI